MSTFDVVPLQAQPNAAGATKVSRISWRLMLACGLMTASMVAAITLSRVALNQSQDVRGAAQWMTSPWGWWFGSPVLWWVAGLATAGTVAACFTIIGRGGQWAWGVLLSSSIALLGIGVWYILGVALIANGQLLRGPWYIVALSGGGLAAIVLLASVPTRGVLALLNVPAAPGGVMLSSGFMLRSALYGVAMMAIVLVGPLLGSPPAEVLQLVFMNNLRRTQMLHGREGSDRVLLPTGGKTTLRLDQVPRLGPVDAPYVIYHFFDYTDPRSQACHAALRDARKRYGDQFVVLTLPWPLDATLNPYVPAEVAAEHPGAGDYARLAYAVWEAAPEHFEAFHDNLLTPRYGEQGSLAPAGISMPSLQEARAAAEALLDREAIERALADPLLDKKIRLRLDARAPQLVSDPKANANFQPMTSWLRYRDGDGVYESYGVLGAMSSEYLFESLEKFWGIKPQHTDVSQNDSIMELLN